MQIKFMAAVLTGLFVISNSVIAEECSSRSEDSVFIMDCLSARYKAADQELNVIYSEAMKALSSDGKKKLKESQEAWLNYRDASLALKMCIRDRAESGHVAQWRSPVRAMRPHQTTDAADPDWALSG